jgi:hypothetical protein
MKTFITAIISIVILLVVTEKAPLARWIIMLMEITVNDNTLLITHLYIYQHIFLSLVALLVMTLTAASTSGFCSGLSC